MRTSTKKIKEISVEAYLVAKVKAEQGFATKNDANTYVGIPDRTVGVLGYMCMVELKRPKGGRFSSAQRMWKKFLHMAGVPWHHIKTHSEVDDFIAFVKARHAAHTQTTGRG